MKHDINCPAGPYYIHGEDLAPGLVGPFPTRDAAQEHLDFQRRRGDASVCVHGNAVLMTEELAKRTWAWDNNRATPEKDRELGNWTPYCAQCGQANCKDHPGGNPTPAPNRPADALLNATEEDSGGDAEALTEAGVVAVMAGAPKPAFRLLHRNDRNGPGWEPRSRMEFASIHELFDYSPDAAYWFVRHPNASYFEYDHGKGLHWRYERVGEVES